MDSTQAQLLTDVDAAALGERIRAARIARGWTQSDLAGDIVSVGYVSRVENGQRHPTANVVVALAARLEVPLHHLLRDDAAREHETLRLELDYAELSLESGQQAEAEFRAREALAKATRGSLPDLALRARYLVARSLEMLGNLDDAIIELENVLDSPRGGVLRIHAAIALCRCLRDSGDLAQSVSAGERLLEELSGTPLDATDESVQLAVTLAASYFSRGDLGQAIRTCRRAIGKAEELGSAKARASAYWNASLMEAERGAIGDAVPLAERALALLAEGRDVRNLARLRSAVADLQLHLDPPQMEEANRNLDQAVAELRNTSGSTLDLARAEVSRARSLLLQGDYGRLLDVAGRVVAETRDVSPLLAADALAVAGQALVALDRTEDAAAHYRQAVMLLTGVGADRGAAQLWFEIAELLDEVGEERAARDAFRSAAASTGLQSNQLRAGRAADRTDVAGAQFAHATIR